MMNRIGEFVQTYSGKAFYPLDPREEDIDIADIAHALSLQCRFNGHCKQFYSVAEHSCIIAANARPENALWGLLHDAAEAYTSDMPRPLKKMIKVFTRIENNIMNVICNKYGLSETMPDEIKLLDNRLLHTEKLQLMSEMQDSENQWQELPEPLDWKINCFDPVIIKREFLLSFDFYSKKIRW